MHLLPKRRRGMGRGNLRTAEGGVSCDSFLRPSSICNSEEECRVAAGLCVPRRTNERGMKKAGYRERRRRCRRRRRRSLDRAPLFFVGECVIWPATERGEKGLCARAPPLPRRSPFLSCDPTAFTA